MRYEKIEAFLQYWKKNKKTVLLITGVVTLLILLQFILSVTGDNLYIHDGTGEITGITRHSADEEIAIPLKVIGEKGKARAEEELVISLSGKKDKKSQEKNGLGKEETLSAELRKLSFTLDKPGEKVIPLPQILEDGTKLSWEKPNNQKALLLVLFIPFVLIFLYRMEIDNQRKKKTRQIAEIRKALPGFNSQMLLLLHSGLIFNDAFSLIAQNAEKRTCKENRFGQLIYGILVESRETSSSLITLLDGHAKEMRIRELSRIVGVMVDNQYKGVNLVEKLEAESETLWTQRKKDAEEKGKLAETKLAFPLAMLLLVLILITAAPAILQM